MRGRRVVAAVIVLTAFSACGDARSEVVTNNGGVLDCPSLAIEYAHFDRSPEAPGSSTPTRAAALLTPDLGLPPGTPTMESEGPASVVFIYTDGEGNRLGRVFVSNHDTGWFVDEVERCD